MIGALHVKDVTAGRVGAAEAAARHIARSGRSGRAEGTAQETEDEGRADTKLGTAIGRADHMMMVDAGEFDRGGLYHHLRRDEVQSANDDHHCRRSSERDGSESPSGHDPASYEFATSPGA